MKYQITYIIEVDDDTDPSSILDAAEETIDDLIGQLDALNVDAKHDDLRGDSPSVEEWKPEEER